MGDDRALFKEACRISIAYGMDPDRLLDEKKLWQFTLMGNVVAEKRKEAMKDSLLSFHAADPTKLMRDLSDKDEEEDPMDQWAKLYEATGDKGKAKKIKNMKLAKKLMKEEQDGRGKRR